jgi:two-component system sensor histidine kinase YesM
VYTLYDNDFNGKRKRVFSYIREYYTREIEEYYKLIKIDLDIDNFNKYILDNYNEKIYIYDKNNTIIFTNDTRFTNKTRFFNMKDVDVDDNYIINQSSIKLFESLNYNIIVAKEEIGLLKYENLLRTTLLLVFINLILPSIMMIIFYKSINTRLNTVTDFIRNRKENDFSTIDITPAKDEIGILISSFNKMNTRNKMLIEDVYETNIQKQNVLIEKKQAEINALLSQINPHFLFNSLETIRMRSLLKGEKETSNMIMCLSKIFRNSMSWQSNLIYIKDEINIVKMLLEIEKYRFDDKLNYKIICDESIYKYKIPKMCIVTFVENACIHGIENIDYTGIISIMLKKDGDYVICKVIDNGKGMETNEINQLRKYLCNSNSYDGNIGMKNVFKRFKLLYNNDFTFEIANRDPHGFEVRFKLPITSEEL